MIHRNSNFLSYFQDVCSVPLTKNLPPLRQLFFGKKNFLDDLFCFRLLLQTIYGFHPFCLSNDINLVAKSKSSSPHEMVATKSCWIVLEKLRSRKMGLRKNLTTWVSWQSYWNLAICWVLTLIWIIIFLDFAILSLIILIR